MCPSPQPEDSEECNMNEYCIAGTIPTCETIAPCDAPTDGTLKTTENCKCGASTTCSTGLKCELDTDTGAAKCLCGDSSGKVENIVCDCGMEQWEECDIDNT